MLGAQQRPSVAALNNGEFVVSWDDGTRIFAQRYDGNGNAAGGEIQVNAIVSSTRYASTVTGLNDGSFVVAWTAFTSGGAGDGNGYGISAQRFDATGNPLGATLAVNTEISSTQDIPAIASLSDGGFVVTWNSATSGTAGDGNSTGVFGQRFDAAGAMVGGEFQVNT